MDNTSSATEKISANTVATAISDSRSGIRQRLMSRYERSFLGRRASIIGRLDPQQRPARAEREENRVEVPSLR